MNKIFIQYILTLRLNEDNMKYKDKITIQLERMKVYFFHIDVKPSQKL